MPTKQSRARRWMKKGKAVGKFNKLGIFYVQLVIMSKLLKAIKHIEVGLVATPKNKFLSLTKTGNG